MHLYGAAEFAPRRASEGVLISLKLEAWELPRNLRLCC